MLSANHGPIAQKGIPLMKDLCNALERNNSSERLKISKSTFKWRQDYVLSDGTPGVYLLDWSSSKGQTELQTMTQSYIDAGGNGSRYWPPSGHGAD